MATHVIKRDGSKEPFAAEKLTRSIESAAHDAGITPERTQELVDQILPIVMEVADGQEEIATTELRDTIIAELEVAEPTAAEAWRAHDAAKGGV